MIEGTDTRLCVDCRAGDNSSVFNVEMLDDMEKWEALFPGRPWLFDTDENPVQAFATEDEACAAQRAYRASRGFEPLSGNRSAPQYVIVYLDTDANGDDLLDSGGNPIAAGFYRYRWPLQGYGCDPDGPFPSELDAGDGIPL